MPAPRNRLSYFAIFLGVIALGLASRRYPGLFPGAFVKYPGDTLWALMVFVGWGIVFPKRPATHIFIYALVSSYCVEFCKLYRAPWIVGLRATTAGRLILGSTFSWENLVAYTLGALLGVLVERWMRRRANWNSSGRPGRCT
jgi:hypothetical protein